MSTDWNEKKSHFSGQTLSWNEKDDFQKFSFVNTDGKTKERITAKQLVFFYATGYTAGKKTNIVRLCEIRRR